jgi:putative Holliday junction resolvase
MDSLSSAHLTLIGFDLGSKSLGIAIKNKLGMILPLPAIFFPRVDETQLRHHVMQLIEAYQPTELIFGIPFHADGRESDQTRWVRGVVHRLQLTISIPIKTIDERFTTIEAKERLHMLGIPEKKQKEYIDSLSACVILEQYESKSR